VDNSDAERRLGLRIAPGAGWWHVAVLRRIRGGQRSPAPRGQVRVHNRVPPKVVSEILAHASIVITADIYGHVLPDVSREALAALSASLRRNGGQERWSNRLRDSAEAVPDCTETASDLLLLPVGMTGFEPVTP
jgi:hypothetical protein